MGQQETVICINDSNNESSNINISIYLNKVASNEESSQKSEIAMLSKPGRKTKQKKAPISVTIDNDLISLLKAEQEETGYSMSSIVEEAVRRYYCKHESY